MQIVIDINEKDYNDIMFDVETSPRLLNRYEWLIAHGRPIPKGHGRLIDKDKMIADLLTVDPRYQDLIDWCLRVTEAQPTIIETDTENECEYCGAKLKLVVNE